MQDALEQKMTKLAARREALRKKEAKAKGQASWFATKERQIAHRSQGSATL
jgi:hypothetical protein